MELQWAVLTLLALLETSSAVDKTLMDLLDDFSLTKSLGYSHNTLEDARLNHEYMEQYLEMLRANQETYYTVNAEGRRQRHTHQVYSPVRRRARSETLRREKLNSQSLRSHVQHTQQSSLEGSSRETDEY